MISAYLLFGVKLILFAAVAVGGILVGIRFRKAKDSKEANMAKEAKGNESNE